jgi:hypothetical protein
MMGEAVRLHRLAQRCLGSLGGDKPTRLVLSLFFKAVVGIPRVFHFETLADKGFAILSGGRSVLGRNTLGGLIRAAPVRGVLRMLHLSEPVIHRARVVPISVDEHVVPRFTRKFDIKKGFHTIRNKKMKAEKLFFSFALGAHRLLSLVATRGNAKLIVAATQLTDRLRTRAQGAEIRVVLDAGAADNHGRLMDFAARPRQVTLVRVPRRRAYLKKWEALPASRWQRAEEPGPHTTAPPKVIHVAETRTTLVDRRTRGQHRQLSVRTIVVREARRSGKERWHALWIIGDDTSGPRAIIEEFRTRQQHEQTYRIMLHDIHVDTAPSGYDKESANLRRPGFKQNAITLYAWVAALATNALDQLTAMVAPFVSFHAHPRTLRRWLLNVTADLYLGADTLIVHLKPTHLRKLWVKLLPRVNRKLVRIPWLRNRRLVLALEPPPRWRLPEPSRDPRKPSGSVWC